MFNRLVVVHPDAEVLAEAAAARLLTAILDLQSVRRPVHLGLTGGGIGLATLAAATDSPLTLAVDWTGVHFWFTDERFLPLGDPERNETGAREALLDGLIAEMGLPAGNVHSVRGPETGDDVAAAAQAYATEFDAAVGAEGLDLALLGMGPDGHVASLFPGNAGMQVDGVSVTPVTDSPKPPPVRVSFTFDALNASQEVWLLVAGAEKAEAVAAALAGDLDVPSARVAGRRRSLWLLDSAAAEPPGR